MSNRSTSRSLVGLLAVVLVAAFPDVASATSPQLTLSVDQSAGTAAGSSPATSITASYPSPTNGFKDLTFQLPPGLFANLNIDNGACLTSTMPVPACQVGTGMSVVGSSTVPYTLYLVPPPTPTALAGVAQVFPSGPGVVGALTLRTTPDVGLNATFSVGPTTLPVTMVSLRLTDLRLPTSCPSPSADLMVVADTQFGSTPLTATAPFNVTGCTSLPFTPQLKITATKDTADNNVALTTSSIQQNALAQAADKTVTLTVPPAVLSPNLTNALALLNSGTSVGTATAISPLLPVPMTGHVTLTGTALASNLTVTFPPPFQLSLQGGISRTSSSVMFSDMPDLPLSNFSMSLYGGASGLHETTCNPAGGTLMGVFAGQNGVTATSNVPFSIAGCSTATTPGLPTVTGNVLSGLGKGHAKFKFNISKGTSAPPVKTVDIGLPSGLKFSSQAKDLKEGVRVSGATFKVSHGHLDITFKHPISTASGTITSPELEVGSKLSHKVKNEAKHHMFKPLTFPFKVTVPGGITTTLTLTVKPTS
jgi:hypothetical protein